VNIDPLRIRNGIPARSNEAIIDAIYDDPTTPIIPLAQKMAQSTKRWDQFKPLNQPGVYTNLKYFILMGIVARITVIRGVKGAFGVDGWAQYTGQAKLGNLVGRLI
jgi:hypothetical protein